MISLQPIPKKIRDRLERKCKAVSRDFGEGEGGAPLEPRSEDLQDTFSKSVWIKLFSPVDSSKAPSVVPITDELKEKWRKKEIETIRTNIRSNENALQSLRIIYTDDHPKVKKSLDPLITKLVSEFCQKKVEEIERFRNINSIPRPDVILKSNHDREKPDYRGDFDT